MKKNKIIGAVLAVSVCILWLIALAYVHEYLKIYMPEQPDTTVAVSVGGEAATTDIDIDLSEYQLGGRVIELMTPSGMIPVSASLDVPFIDQNPELPTGCEITSLTEVLNFYGFDVDKEYMARNYLPMSETAQTGCFINYYLGSPWEDDGSGIFAPGLTDAANKFLKENNSRLRAENISYSEIDALFEQIADGCPVIVWTSFDYTIEEIEYTLVEYETGGSFYWPSYEHCVVLCGYDYEAGTVTFADPTYGIVEHTIEEFENYYQKFFYQAVVIR